MGNRRTIACTRCFNDKSLRKWIRENGRRGDCPWCGARDAYVVPLTQLGPLFREIARIYLPIEGGDAWERGDNISYLLQEDWQIFSNRIEEGSNNLMHELAAAILEAALDPKEDLIDCPDYTGFFQRNESSLQDRWDEDAYHFLTEERVTFDEAPHDRAEEYESVSLPDELSVAFEDLATLYEAGHVLYRARIHKDRLRKERFSLTRDALGAPKPDNAPPGRANRAKEPVLYLASDEETALAEVRAWKGAAVALATMTIQRPVLIVDFLKFETPRSPFFVENLAWKVQLGSLFHRLAMELSRPVMPHEEERLYRPTQYLCERIRNSHYSQRRPLSRSHKICRSQY